MGADICLEKLNGTPYNEGAMLNLRDSGVRKAEIVACLSLAIDLGIGQPMEHSLRTAVLAVRLGEAIGLSEQELTDAYYLALIRCVGCTGDPEMDASVFGDELAAREWVGPAAHGETRDFIWNMVQHVGNGRPAVERVGQVATAFFRMPKYIAALPGHCQTGDQIAARMGFGPRFMRALSQIYEHWNGNGIAKAKGEEIEVTTRVVHVAQDAEYFWRMGGVEAAMAMARKRSGKGYDPRVADVLHARAPSLLSGLDTEKSWELALDSEPGSQPTLSEAELDDMYRLGGQDGDMTLSFMLGHSGSGSRACGWRRPVAPPLRRRGPGPSAGGADPRCRPNRCFRTHLGQARTA